MDSTVSVIIPMFNKEKYIERSISSVLSQSLEPLEIIVVNDGSTDNGAHIVSGMSNSNIVLINQENNGPGAARNVGLACAKGRYVAFLDADDEWLPTFLASGLELLADANQNVKVVFCGYFLYPDRRQIRHMANGLEAGVYNIDKNMDVTLVQDIATFASTCFSIMQTATARHWGGFYDRHKCLLGEDEFFIYKLIFNEKVGIIPESLGIYHTESSDLWGQKKRTPRMLEPFLKEPIEIIEFCPKEKRKLLYELILLRALEVAKSFAINGEKDAAKKLLRQYSTNKYQHGLQRFKIICLVQISSILPILYKIWHITKKKYINEK